MRHFAILAGLVVSLFAADALAAGDVWSGIHTVKSVWYDPPRSRIVVVVEDAITTNPGGCTELNYLEIQGTADDRKAFLSVLTSALLSGSKVKIMVSGSACGIFSHPLGIGVQITK